MIRISYKNWRLHIGKRKHKECILVHIGIIQSSKINRDKQSVDQTLQINYYSSVKDR